MSLTLLPGLLPCTHTLFAVFASDVGEPVVEPVVCFGVFEVDHDGRRLVAAFSQGQHVESADFKPNFISLTNSPDPAPWVEKCRAKATELAEKKAKQKIIVPGDKQIVGVHASE